MGLFSDCCSAIGSFVSGALSAAGSLITSVDKLATKIGTALIPALNTIANVIRVLGVLYDILKPDESIEDIGDKVLHAEEAGITLENSKDFEDYKKKIDEFQITSDKQFTLEQKLAAGILYTEKGIESKNPNLGDLGSLFPLLLLDKSIFTPERVKAYVELATKENVNLDKITNYFNSDATRNQRMDSREFMSKAEESYLKANPKEGTFNQDSFNTKLSDLYDANRSKL